MEPVSIAMVALGAFQMITGAQQADAVRQQARIQRQIDEMNAQFAELDAYKAEQEGYTQEARYQSYIDSVAGEQKVVLASQDIDINFGSAKELQQESSTTGFLNQLDIKNQAHARSLGYTQQARNIRFQGERNLIQANYDASTMATRSLLGGIKTGLSGYEPKDSTTKPGLEPGMQEHPGSYIGREIPGRPSRGLY